MNRLRNLITFIVLSAGLFTTAATLNVGSVSIDNIGMNKRLIRLNDNGILIDNSGICVEVSVGIKAGDLTGHRVLCIVNPLDSEGNILADSNGEAMSATALTIPSVNYAGKVMLPIPYGWLNSLNNVKLGVSLMCLGNDEVGEMKVIDLDSNSINIDKSRVGNKLMGDMLGGSSSGGLGGILMEGLFGGSDAESTQPCPSCEGTRVCQHCDGDGFFDPKSCRKCATDPGICRRCKGEGTVTIKYDIY